MSSNNNVTRFINIIGAALLLVVINTSTVFADTAGLSDSFKFDNPFSPSPYRQVSAEEDDKEGFDPMPGSLIVPRDLRIVLGYSGGIERTTVRGKEAARDVYYHYLSAEAMWHLFNLGEEGQEHTRFEAGFILAGSPHGEYHGARGPDANQDSGNNRYNSEFRNARLGLKVAARSIGDGRGWDASLSAWIGYNFDRGRVGHNDPFAYRSKSITLTWGVRGEFAVNFPVFSLGTYVQTTKVDGVNVDSYSGLLSRISVNAEYQDTFSTRQRRTTVTRLGGTDRQDVSNYSGDLKIHLYRFANDTPDTDEEWLFETDPYIMGHVEGATRYGYAQVRNDHDSQLYGPGAGVQLAINKSLYINLEGIYLFENRGTEAERVVVRFGIYWAF